MTSFEQTINSPCLLPVAVCYLLRLKYTEIDVLLKMFLLLHADDTVMCSETPGGLQKAGGGEEMNSKG